MRVHIIIDGRVDNTVAVESVQVAADLYPEAVCIEATAGDVGWIWDGEALSEPLPSSPPIPSEITRWQALTFLNQSGHLDAVEAYVGSLTDRQAQIDFSAASVWRRDWPWLGDAAIALGWTSSQVDQMFIAAAALKGRQ